MCVDTLQYCEHCSSPKTLSEFYGFSYTEEKQVAIRKELTEVAKDTH